jgi:tetratricopeptide (TPR) repeat protein
MTFSAKQAELLMRQSLDLAQQGDLLGAIEKLEEQTRQYSSYGPAHCLLGDLYLQVGSPMLAIEPLEKAVRLAHEYSLPQYLLGCAFGRLANFQPALDHLFIADRLKPNDPEILRNIGWMKCMSGEVKEGRSYLRRSIKLDPKNGLAYNDLGASYMFTQDSNLKLAERWLKKALELEPNSAFIQNTWQSFQELFREVNPNRKKKNRMSE